MEAEAPKCALCGKPLEGRDRFEGRCAACREAEILGRALPSDAPAAEEAPARVCRACGAPVGPGLDRCAQCGAATKRAPLVRMPLCILLLVVAAAGAAMLLWPGRTGPRRLAPERPPMAPPGTPVAPQSRTETKAAPAKPASPEQAAMLRQETRELLGLLVRGDYDRAINNYAQPDEVDFRRVERALDAIVRGDGSKGFAAWSARLIRLREGRVAEDLRQAGDRQPEFTVALLAHLARDPGVSDAGVNPEDRARNVLRWHLLALFDGLDLAHADVVAVEEVRPGHFAVTLDCRGERKAAWLRGEPTRVYWSRLPVGWVTKVGLADRIEQVRDVLKRPAPVERPAPP